MSDSLRDQLLKAGFAEPKNKPKPKSKSRKKAPGKQPFKGQTSTSPASSGAPVQTEPKAGHTHVPSLPSKKKKSKKAPAVKPRAGSWSTRSHGTSTETQRKENPEAAEKRRAMKAQIQTLIESSALTDFKGEEVYRFTLQNKIRELLVTEAVRKQLANAELAITRLNGTTRIVPAASAIEIRKINPQWLVFLTTDVDDTSEDDEFPIPDDLIW
ncbi:MAG: DUF2058 family protein [Granulosicoccus sp.]